MVEKSSINAAVMELRGVLSRYRSNDIELSSIIDARDEVLLRFQEIFHPEHLSKLTEREFKEFLLFKNNRHWQGLHRMGPKICVDMNKLREALMTLLDEKLPIRERLNQLISRANGPLIPGLGRAVLTPILMICFPERYSVWNNISESAMRKLSLWPEFDRGLQFGSRYDAVNAVQLRIAKEIEVDLWTLDALWWRVSRPITDPLPRDNGNDEIQTFGLERHLHEFLRDNWDKTSLAKDWLIYEEDGDLAGYEYPCDVGRIDILAKHRTESRWLVIELKRDQSNDVTVGQVLRYKGWVKKHLASKDEAVQGMIISHKTDNSLWYALSSIPDVEVQLYEVDFRLLPIVSPIE